MKCTKLYFKLILLVNMMCKLNVELCKCTLVGSCMYVDVGCDRMTLSLKMGI